MIQKSDCESFLPDVHEEIIQHTHIITLNSRQYAVIHDPVELVDGKMKNKLGQKDLRKGECNFFLHPGESIPEGIEDVIVLGENEGIVIVADEEFVGTAWNENSWRKPGPSFVGAFCAFEIWKKNCVGVWEN